MHMIFVALLLVLAPVALCADVLTPPPQPVILNATVVGNSTSYIQWRPLGAEFNITKIKMYVAHKDNSFDLQGLYLSATTKNVFN